MSFTLDQQSVSDLLAYVDRKLRASGCDHSHRFSAAWARACAVNWDDLLDALESRGLSAIAKSFSTSKKARSRITLRRSRSIAATAGFCHRVSSPVRKRLQRRSSYPGRMSAEIHTPSLENGSFRRPSTLSRGNACESSCISSSAWKQDYRANSALSPMSSRSRLPNMLIRSPIHRWPN